MKKFLILASALIWLFSAQSYAGEVSCSGRVLDVATQKMDLINTSITVSGQFGSSKFYEKDGIVLKATWNNQAFGVTVLNSTGTTLGRLGTTAGPINFFGEGTHSSQNWFILCKE